MCQSGTFAVKSHNSGLAAVAVPSNFWYTLQRKEPVYLEKRRDFYYYREHTGMKPFMLCLRLCLCLKTHHERVEYHDAGYADEDKGFEVLHILRRHKTIGDRIMHVHRARRIESIENFVQI